MNKIEMARVKADIFDCWYEGKFHCGEEPTEEECDQFINELNNENEEKLEERWFGLVGEWILSREDIVTGDNYEEKLDNIFEQVKKNRDNQLHGYTTGVTSHKLNEWYD